MTCCCNQKMIYCEEEIVLRSSMNLHFFAPSPAAFASSKKGFDSPTVFAFTSHFANPKLLPDNHNPKGEMSGVDSAPIVQLTFCFHFKKICETRAQLTVHKADTVHYLLRILLTLQNLRLRPMEIHPVRQTHRSWTAQKISFFD